VNQPGVYGTLGAPSASGVPGARAQAAAWTDPSANFWLFGGYATETDVGEGDRNDLWKFTPATNEWTWVGGSNTFEQPGTYGTLRVPAPGNVPGARDQAASWTDAAGNFWLFGGTGLDSDGTAGVLNDLWKYSPTAAMWTWMGGPNTFCKTPATFGCPGVYGTQGIPAPDNAPGARFEPTSWTDSCGNLWLFGGEGSDSLGNGGLLNDLWRYDPATNMWTWMSGANIVGQNGTYGTLGTPDPGNVPGARTGPVTWVDSSGNLWLFGGEGEDWDGILCGNGAPCDLNDLWKYNPATNIWTWMSGSNVTQAPGVYGTEGTPASGNVPGARWIALSWTDAQGNFWLFGGDGFDSRTNPEVFGDLNDLWRYDPSTNLWTWMSGANITDQPATYGTLGTATPGNVPPSREWAVGWIDKSGNLWLFGGVNLSGGLSSSAMFNDLWMYQP
jgi:N-acetylneuraminic acid mutarotase